MSLLNVNGIECRYDGHAVVRDVSLHVHTGGIVSLLGPSGCGKTTVLRAIAGFEPVHAGEIACAGTVFSRPGFSLPPERRRVGMVFQDYALFPHLSITENICFGLRGVPRREQKAIAAQMLEVVGLPGYGSRYPHELSGGQQQRVALGRALAPRPPLLLLDEPFSSLDVDLRERLTLEVRQILKEQGTTAILVTHDQNEAFAMSDQVGVMHEGRIMQWDEPYNLYHEPANRFVADFIGKGVFLHGRLVEPDSFETEIGVLRGNRAYPWGKGTPVDVLVRPDDIQPDDASSLRAEVRNKAFMGAEIMYTLRLPAGGTVLAMFPSHLDHAVGEVVGIRVDAAHLVAFPNL